MILRLNYLQKEKKVMTRKCPKCGQYMSSAIKYDYGHPIVVHECSCGYSELQEWMKYSDKLNYDNVTKICKDSIGGI